jgi:Protein of unknown function (DUF1579)
MRLERVALVAMVSAGMVMGGLARAAITNDAAAVGTPPPAPSGPKTPVHPDQAKAAKAAELSAAHKVLSGFVGNWKTTIHMLQADGSAGAKDTAGTAEGKMELGGRFVEMTHTGVLGGQPYEGKMICGYDDVVFKYTSAWVDTTSPAIITYIGDYDAKKKQFNLSAHYSDQVSRKYVVARVTMTFVDADTIVVDEYMAHAVGGAEQHTLTVTYKRA